ncbi:hypothetical protein [Yinghuangia soli]|uniref:Uncharacterized protein n=1 Tax=Yinghuangia soli TaxID=2908204 RepID=A0AA41Q598_9ACTN|nr:hypothetical protein [Yinghuangia soli]MCF2531835.1 hypothetical protein [Yinghuangia soli]
MSGQASAAQPAYWRPPPRELPTSPARLARLAVAACCGTLAFAAANVYASLVYRDWRAELAARIDDPAERAELADASLMIRTGNGATQWAGRLIVLAFAAMVALLVCWAVAAQRNRRAFRHPRPGFVAWPRDEWEREAKQAARLRIGPIPLAWLCLAVFAVVLFLRAIGPMSHYYDESTLQQLEMETDYVGERIVYALTHAGCALAAGVVVLRTTRRQLAALRRAEQPGGADAEAPPPAS